MNHLKLVANQNALVQRYQAGVSEKLLDDAWEGFIVASHSFSMLVYLHWGCHSGVMYIDRGDSYPWRAVL
jgi:hypothetical protein